MVSTLTYFPVKMKRNFLYSPTISLLSTGMMGFCTMAKVISEQWKIMEDSQRKLFEERALEDKKRYAIETEAWLLSQVPTAHVKKRLAALRRGSLKKFLLQSSVKLPRSAKSVPPPSPSPSVATTNTPVVARTIKETSVPENRFAVVSPQSSLSEDGRHQGQPADLQQLCDMQLQLYQDQLRLQQVFEDSSSPIIIAAKPAATNHYYHTAAVAQPPPPPVYTNYRMPRSFAPGLSAAPKTRPHHPASTFVRHQGQQQLDTIRQYEYYHQARQNEK